MCLVDDPRREHAKGKKIGIEHLGNVAGGNPTEYLNVPNQFMKDCVRAILTEKGIRCGSARTAVRSWIASAARGRLTCSSTAASTMWTSTWTRRSRVRFGDSAMNHAMAFVGVDVADDGTTTRRWRVENSWGDKIADKGYFTMSDDWFTSTCTRWPCPRRCSRPSIGRARRARHHAPRMGSDGCAGLSEVSARASSTRLNDRFRRFPVSDGHFTKRNVPFDGESSLTAVFRYCWMTMMFLARGPRIGCGIAE